MADQDASTIPQVNLAGKSPTSPQEGIKDTSQVPPQGAQQATPADTSPPSTNIAEVQQAQQPATPVAETPPQQGVSGGPPPTGPAPVGEQQPASSADKQPFADAPEGFIQQEKPSAFEADAVPPKGKKKRSVFVWGCLIAMVLLLAVGGVGAYAYFTDAEIPIISDIIKRLKNVLRDPQAEAVYVQEQLARTIVGTVLPITGNKGGIVSAFAQSSVSEETIQEYVAQYENIESLRFDFDMKSSDTKGESTILLRGAFDLKEADNEKISSVFSYVYKSDGEEGEVAGEVRTIGDSTYIKFGKYPETGDEYSGTDFDIKEKWLDMTADDVEQTSEAFVEQGDKQEVTDDDIDKLIRFITDERVLKNIELLDDEEIYNNDCQCIRLSWNQSELVEVLRTYAEIFEEEFDENEATESVKDIESLQLEACVGKQTQQIHRLGLIVRGTSGSEDMNIDLKLWDYGKDMNIIAPSDAVSFEDILKELYPGYEDILLQSQLISIQFSLESYYAENGEYPEGLDELDLEGLTINLDDVTYEKTGDSYVLSVTLSDGEVYEVQGGE